MLVAAVTEFKICVGVEIGVLRFPAIHEYLIPLPRYCVVDDLPSDSSAAQTNILAPKYCVIMNKDKNILFPRKLQDMQPYLITSHERKKAILC